MPIRQEVDLVLEEILEVEGITGVIASGASGDIIATRMPSIYDFESLSQVSKKLVNAAMNMNLAIDTSDLISFHYSDDMRLLFKPLMLGFLIVMSVSNVNVLLLDIATNYSCEKISRILSLANHGGREAKFPENSSN